MAPKRVPRSPWRIIPTCEQCGNQLRVANRGVEQYGGKTGLVCRTCFLAWMNEQKLKGIIP